MFLFGGNNYGRSIHVSDPHSENADKSYTPLFALNMKTFAWYQVKTRGDNVKPRDEHTAIIDEGSNSLVVFGGFEDGERTNETIFFNLKTYVWSMITLESSAKKPCPRSGHSACVSGNTMYVFGGKSDNATKLNDLWAFNLNKYTWS